MSNLSSHDSSGFLRAVDAELRRRVKESLKAPLMKIAEAEVDKAVNEAVEALNSHLNAYRDPANMRDTIEVILRRAP